MKKKTLFIIKVILLLVFLAYLYNIISQKKGFLAELKQEIVSAWFFPNYLLLALAVLLLFLNWGLEARKWQILSAKIQKISFIHAFKGTIAGLSLGFITPHALGDYLGRVAYLPSQHKLDAIGAVLLGRVSQFFITFFIGIWAYYYFLMIHFQLSYPHSLLMLSLILFFNLLFLLGLYYNKLIIIHLFQVKRLKKVVKYFIVLRHFTSVEITRVLVLSLLRYCTFSFQFILMLYFFQVSLHWFYMLVGVSLVFLGKSSVPSFNFLSDLGVRESFALYFFSFYAVSHSRVLLASLALWCINILFPTLLGMVWVMAYNHLKYFKHEKQE